jgi:tetratricopeptide (TPR) repeat protein
LRAAERALEIEPDDPFASSMRAFALAGLRGDAEAVEPLRQAAELMPESFLVHDSLARIYHRLDRAAEAVAAARKGLECDPLGVLGSHPSAAVRRHVEETWRAWRLAGQAELHGILAWGYRELGRSREATEAAREAVALARRAIEAGPADWQTWTNLGITLELAGHPDDAIGAWRRAFELAPRPETWRPLASALYDARRYDEAVEVLRRASTIAPGPEDDAALGAALGETGRYEEAIGVLRRAVESAPHSRALNSLAWILATCPEEALRRPDEAVELARRAAAAAPGEWAIRNTLGVALYRAGQFQEAIVELRKSQRLGGGACDGLLLAMAHWKLGREETARWWLAHSVGRLKTEPANEEIDRFRAEAEALLGR